MNRSLLGVAVVAVVAVLAAPAIAEPAETSIDGPSQLQPGENVTYTFTLTNTGENESAYLLNATLPDGWEIVERTDDGGNWQDSDTEWLYLSIEPGATKSPSLTVSVPENADDGTIEITSQASTSDGTQDNAAKDVTVEDNDSGGGDGGDGDSGSDDGGSDDGGDSGSDDGGSDDGGDSGGDDGGDSSSGGDSGGDDGGSDDGGDSSSGGDRGGDDGGDSSSGGDSGGDDGGDSSSGGDSGGDDGGDSGGGGGYDGGDSGGDGKTTDVESNSTDVESNSTDVESNSTDVESNSTDVESNSTDGESDEATGSEPTRTASEPADESATADVSDTETDDGSGAADSENDSSTALAVGLGALVLLTAGVGMVTARQNVVEESIVETVSGGLQTDSETASHDTGDGYDGADVEVLRFHKGPDKCLITYATTKTSNKAIGDELREVAHGYASADDDDIRTQRLEATVRHGGQTLATWHIRSEWLVQFEDGELSREEFELKVLRTMSLVN